MRKNTANYNKINVLLLCIGDIFAAISGCR